eukprot:scaffold468_cov216-Pinguiococcus_pyrenoidosus.AAC.7
MDLRSEVHVSFGGVKMALERFLQLSSSSEFLAISRDPADCVDAGRRGHDWGRLEDALKQAQERLRENEAGLQVEQVAQTAPQFHRLVPMMLGTAGQGAPASV